MNTMVGIDIQKISTRHSLHPCTAQGLPLLCAFLTPDQAIERCQGLTMEYGTEDTPIGSMLAAWCAEGICHMCFAPTSRFSLEDMRTQWPSMAWKENPQAATRLLRRIFAVAPGGHETQDTPPLRLLMRGAPFQLEVWRTLLDIPSGQTITYGQLAARAGRPGAARAVGTAMALNPVVFLVPCHRVLCAGGHIGQYGGGSQLKARLLRWEAGLSPTV